MSFTTFSLQMPLRLHKTTPTTKWFFQILVFYTRLSHSAGPRGLLICFRVLLSCPNFAMLCCPFYLARFRCCLVHLSFSLFYVFLYHFWSLGLACFFVVLVLALPDVPCTCASSAYFPFNVLVAFALVLFQFCCPPPCMPSLLISWQLFKLCFPHGMFLILASRLMFVSYIFPAWDVCNFLPRGRCLFLIFPGMRCL